MLNVTEFQMYKIPI